MGPNHDTANFIKALIGVAIMAVVTFVGVWATKWDDSGYTDEEDA
jgi:PTS system beta-glucosides-specific IIC component